ncbi:MAG: SagB/ThcOx family dehydrogenase [Gaiellaceae bacterium]
MTDSLDTLVPLSLVYGREGVALDDPAELYHEASKLSPALGARQVEGIARLATSGALQAATLRAVRGNRHRASVPLPEVERLARLERGPSPERFDGARLPLASLASVLEAGYGVARPQRRTVPSGGALYPLELYPVAARVDGLGSGVYHFDPVRRVLEVVRTGAVRGELADTSPRPGVLDGAASVVFVAAVFWRTRFKYGLRGYRFALLEAGHCAQNMLLAAHAAGVAALPLGGFFDARAEALVGVDGVEESVVYAVALGGDAS